MKRRLPQGLTKTKIFRNQVNSVLTTIRDFYDKNLSVTVDELGSLASDICTDKLLPATNKAGEKIGGLVNQARNTAVKAYANSVLKAIEYYHPMKDYWAVDIGDGAIRLARLAKTADGYALRNYFEQTYEVPKGSTENDEARAAALKVLLQSIGLVNADVVFSISGQAVFTRCRTLPPVPDKNVKKIINYEIQQQIPFGLDKLNIDHWTLDRGPKGEYEVIMLAVKQDVVAKFIKIFEGAGCRVHGVGVDGIAAYNWFKHSGLLKTSATAIALIDIGVSITEIMCEVNGQFRFIHPLNVGCVPTPPLSLPKPFDPKKVAEVAASYQTRRQAEMDQLRHELEKEECGNDGDLTTIPGPEATAVFGSVYDVLDTGIPIPGDTETEGEVQLPASAPEAEDENEAFAAAFGAVETSTPTVPVVLSYERLASEIIRSFSYFRSLSGGAPIQEVYLTGEGSNNGELVDALAQRLGELGISVIWYGCLGQLNVSNYLDLDISNCFGDKLHSPNVMPTVLGLALGCHNAEAIDVNLLPEISEK